MGAEGSGPGKLDGVMRCMTSSGDGDRPGGRGMRRAGHLPQVTGHGCAAGHVLCAAMQAARQPGKGSGWAGKAECKRRDSVAAWRGVCVPIYMVWQLGLTLLEKFFDG